MSLPSFPPLVLRDEKLSVLEHAEMDANLRGIRSYSEMLAGLFGVSLNPDGSLLHNSVTTVSLQDRSVTQAKLDSRSAFAAEDTGPTNALEIAFTPPLTAYADGQIFYVKVLNSNTSAATVNVDSLGPIAIKKRGVVDLELGDYLTGSLIVLGYFGGVFHLMSGGTSSSSSSSTGGFSGFTTYEPVDVAIPAVATSILHSSGVNVTDGNIATIDSTVYRFKNVLALAYDVKIGADAATTLANLKKAINASGTAGTNYFAGTLIHPTVSAGALTSTDLNISANTPGTAANSIVTTTNEATYTWTAGTMAGGVSNTYIALTHGFASTPNDSRAFLVCTSDDLVFAAGDIVPLAFFEDGSGLPAFALSANATTIKVERASGLIKVSGLGAINTAKWTTRVRSEIITSAAAVMFPALSIQVRSPQGGFSNGYDLFMASRGATSVIHMCRVALSTNNVTRLTPAASSPDHEALNFAPFGRVDGSNVAVYTSSTGIYELPLLQASPWQPVQRSTYSLAYAWKPVHIVESGGSITETYVVPSNNNSGYFLNSVPLYKITMASAASLLIGTNANFTNASIVNLAGFLAWHPNPGSIRVNMFQYNSIKKRIYMITGECALLHIFTIDDSGFVVPKSILEWWTVAGRYTKLTYVKTLSVPGEGGTVADTLRENYSIDVDLTTGDERAIVFTRTGYSGIVGSITRVPWRE